MAKAPRLILVKDGICPQRGDQSECSILKGDVTQKAQQLPAISSLPSGRGGTSSPLSLHLNPDLLGAHGISINRVWPGLEHPVTMPILPPLINSIHFVAHTLSQHILATYSALS